MVERIVKHLREDYTIPVRDPLWKHIYLSKGLRAIMLTKEFQRLGGIRQLGPAALVYPGAVHTRLNHSLGVFYLARRILKNILLDEACPDHLTLEGVKSFLCAAFLHDIGHFPHAHTLTGLPLEEHEVLARRSILESPIGKIIADEVGGDPELTVAIIDDSYPCQWGAELSFFRCILSGVLDPDKLDYLNRDAYFCGVPYGTQDIDFAISQIRPWEGGMGITQKGVSAVENVLFSKYLMYKTVYWHSDVRISTALVKKAIYLALKEGCLLPEELYKMDDRQFLDFMLGVPGVVGFLTQGSIAPREYKILWQTPVEEDNPLHQKLQNVDFRHSYEGKLTSKLKRLSPEASPETEVVLDIPPKISFEMDIPVLGKGHRQDYSNSPTVFSAPVVAGFNRSLQYLSLIVPTYLGDLPPLGEENLFNDS